MMKRLTVVFMAFAMLAMSGAAFGQQGENTQEKALPEQFLNMGNMIIDGENIVPLFEYYNGLHKPDFGRLLILEKSFLTKIQESSADNALD